MTQHQPRGKAIVAMQFQPRGSSRTIRITPYTGAILHMISKNCFKLTSVHYRPDRAQKNFLLFLLLYLVVK